MILSFPSGRPVPASDPIFEPPALDMSHLTAAPRVRHRQEAPEDETPTGGGASSSAPREGRDYVVGTDVLMRQMIDRIGAAIEASDRTNGKGIVDPIHERLIAIGFDALAASQEERRGRDGEAASLLGSIAHDLSDVRNEDRSLSGALKPAILLAHILEDRLSF